MPEVGEIVQKTVGLRCSAEFGHMLARTFTTRVLTFRAFPWRSLTLHDMVIHDGPMFPALTPRGVKVLRVEDGVANQRLHEDT